MELNLKDKIITVTGGAKGIGESISRTLAKEGATPIIVGRNEEDNIRLTTSIKDAGGNADYFTAELTHVDECKKAVDAIISKYKRIDGLINNAGVNDGVGLENGSYESFMHSLHKNLVHYYLMAQYALPYLKISKGAIVNIS